MTFVVNVAEWVVSSAVDFRDQHSELASGLQGRDLTAQACYDKGFSQNHLQVLGSSVQLVWCAFLGCVALEKIIRAAASLTAGSYGGTFGTTRDRLAGNTDEENMTAAVQGSKGS